MDFLPDIETLTQWLLYYGSFSLFLLLALGIVALPVPEETLMVLAGLLIRNGTLPMIPTIAAALGGSICGITISYIIGRTAGYYFFHKYGPWIGLKESHLQRVHQWFERYGTWALLIGYFIPGIRHITGLTAGASELEFPRFALFAYLGALLWVTTFLSIGYFFGNYGINLLEHLEIGGDEILFGALILIVVVLLFKFRRKTHA